MTRLGRVLLGFTLMLALAWVLLPLFWILSISLKTQTEAFALPPPLIFIPTLDNYKEIFLYSPDFLKNLQNGVAVALSSTFASIAIATPAAYALGRLRIRGQETLAYGILWTSMVPTMGIALPFFVMFSNLLNTIIPLTMTYMVIRLPFTVWLIRGFTLDLPRELEEAAYIDGSSWFKMMRKILLPILAPSLAATMVIDFIFNWNEFMLALMLTGIDSRTATVGLFNFIGRETFRWGPLTAYAIVITVPVVIFSFIVQRYLVRGLTFGAVKG
jgi:multiple sugar transport system permease protein